MRKLLSATLLTFATFSLALGQKKEQRVVTTDIDNFWKAYDRMQTTSDSLQQLHYLQTLYLDKGTPGLKALVEEKNYQAVEWVTSIRRHPNFWKSLRPRTQLAKSGAKGLEPQLKKLKSLYPALRPAQVYFSIGMLRTVGTFKDNMVLIGTEIATGNTSVDLSELPQNLQTYLSRYFKQDPFTYIIPLNVHEYIHTQQKGLGSDLLGKALFEGACDFLSELVTGTRMPLPYMEYGPKHEPELKEQFKAEMFAPLQDNWFYNQSADHPDLGYYMGYSICKSYYQQAKNKRQAIKEMIELDYDNPAATEAFLAASMYYQEPINRSQLLQAYEAKRPIITHISPITGSDSLVDASVKELRVEFSHVMSRFTATDYGAGGKEEWPVVGRKGFSEDKKAYIYLVDLQPGKTYSLKLNGGGFSAVNGYPLKTYEIRFKTKE
ncbi:hypothetical protein [Nibribacter koreensis]|uniref:DUF2268 domain-containing protein n=1 Tax=Nibribacter koreensis TaxID=1084519 RepID=A0ABP8FI17_9BACT